MVSSAWVGVASGKGRGLAAAMFVRGSRRRRSARGVRGCGGTVGFGGRGGSYGVAVGLGVGISRLGGEGCGACGALRGPLGLGGEGVYGAGDGLWGWGWSVGVH